MHSGEEQSELLYETEALLNNQTPDSGLPKYGTQQIPNAAAAQLAPGFAPALILPIPFLAAVGVAATAATTVFAYAFLLCKDPTKCRSHEQTAYATTVAAASLIGNISALAILGPMEKLVAKHRKSGLVLWLIFRSMSVVVLAFGVSIRSIIVAVSGRVFQGLASDNMLHFALNTIYVQTPDARQLGKLIGASLALYMVGISVSPAIASFLPDFSASFAMALIVFLMAFLYLVFGIQTAGTKDPKTSVTAEAGMPESDSSLMKRMRSILQTISSPLSLFAARPILSFSGFSLFFYTSAQSYLFPAMMVDTSIRFGFDGAQNGYMISLAHAMASVYLFFILFALPRLTGHGGPNRGIPSPDQSRDVRKDSIRLTLISLGMQGTALALFSLADQAWQVYPIVMLVALGLATPSYIKTYFMILTSSKDASRAVAATSMMEALGSLLSPVLLGGWQVLWPGSTVFLVGAFVMLFCVVLFTTGAAIDSARERKENSSAATIPCA